LPLALATLDHICHDAPPATMISYGAVSQIWRKLAIVRGLLDLSV
jgi:hypothetical protein